MRSTTISLLAAVCATALWLVVACGEEGRDIDADQSSDADSDSDSDGPTGPITHKTTIASITRRCSPAFCTLAPGCLWAS